MKNQVIHNRLTLLREAMAQEKIDFYLIPTADYHGSEYVSDFFKVREYFSGFTGSAGSLLVSAYGAWLWTDGRYFIQAAKELEGTGITLMKQREEGVPTIEEFLVQNMQEQNVLGFDGKVLSYQEIASYEKALAYKKVRFSYQKDLANTIWTKRPKFPSGEVRIISDDISGKSSIEKIELVRSKLDEIKADALFLSKLDDIMWLCNIRGCDVECNPVAVSYIYLDQKQVVLFIQKSVLNQEIFEHLCNVKIDVMEYENVGDYLQKIRNQCVLIDTKVCNYISCKYISQHNKVIEGPSPTNLLKAIKNPIEQMHMKELYLKDSVAVTKFIYWLKTNIGKIDIDEITAADQLEKYRREIPEFLDLSFPTISGYGSNAAMMHYEATKDNFSKLEPKGFLLVDSGAQYLGATTDVTRTIVLGPLTEEEKEHYNLVAAGMIQMTNAKFLYGCTGRNLDILARQPLWAKGIDYKCGTGHGVGYILNVHEGPQALRWQYVKDNTEAIFEEGMDVTNEPGVYIEGKHGIRIENVMLTKKAEKNENGQFMEFETLTYVPLDKDALDDKYLTQQQKQWIISYQKKVFEKVSPYLNEEERCWLKQETDFL